jgi:hypothetical protein
MYFLTTLDSNLEKITNSLSTLIKSFWKYAVIILAVAIIIWGIYIGIKIITANKRDEKVNAKGMVKSLIIGIVIIFVIAVGGPLLIKGLEAWFNVSSIIKIL